MLAIPLYLLLFAFFVFLAIIFAFLIINVYHIVMGGSLTFASFFVTLVVLVSSAVVIIVTHRLLQGTVWQDPLTVINTAWFRGWFSLSL